MASEAWLKQREYDSESIEHSVHILYINRTAIGDAIFQGCDFHTIQLRSDFSELLLQHLNGGGTLNLLAIGNTLARFTPERVLKMTDPAWKGRATQEWEQLGRQRIFLAIERFFLHGGLQRRIEEQNTFFAALYDAGIQFDIVSHLIDQVLHASDWRKTFVEQIEKPRQHGVKLSGPKIDKNGISAALYSAGFSSAQQRLIWCNIEDSKCLD